MSISDKLITVAEKMPKLYNTGAENFGMKFSATGELVSINNVHSKEHRVDVGLGSKNLVDMHNPDKKPTWDAFERIDDNTIRFYGCSGYGNAELAYRVYAPVGTKVTISYEDELGGEATGRWYIVQPLGWSFKSGSAPTVPEQGYLDFTFARSGGSGNNRLGWVDIKNLQVEIGSTATSYTPYISNFSEVKVEISGKNLLNLEGREVVNFGSWANTAKRIFPQGKGIILALASNNYYSGASGAAHTYSIDNGTLSYDVKTDYYGIGLDLKLMPNTKYRFSYSTRVGGTTLMEYDSEGNYLGSQYLTSIITTKPNTAWGVLNFNDVVKTVSVTRPQFEYGSTITEYEPYNKASAEYTPTADGTVEGVKSISPTMNISTDTAGVVVSAECFLDPQQVINELSTTLISIGGSI